MNTPEFMQYPILYQTSPFHSSTNSTILLVSTPNRLQWVVCMEKGRLKSLID